MKNLECPSKVVLYNDPSTFNLRLSEIKDYLESKLTEIEVITRDNLFNFYFSNHIQDAKALNTKDLPSELDAIIFELSERLANTKVRDLNNPKKSIKPLPGEIAFEKKQLKDTTKTIPGILYDGFKLHELFQGILLAREIKREVCHILFTPRLFGTFDENDRRYHARVILCGYPSIISTTGVVEAPAKPKEYYQIKQGLVMQNISIIDEFVPNELKQKYLNYNDPKITEILKGYVMQAILYHITSDPFCVDPNCRLYNAHWQEELIQAQLTKPEFCSMHTEFISQL